MDTTPKVSEIFKAAGEAFNRLGELTMQLQNQNSENSHSKWGEEDIDMLQSAITNFGEDLNKISVRVKNRTASQIRQTLTKQVFEEAGIRVQQVPQAAAVHHPATMKIISAQTPPGNNGHQQSPTATGGLVTEPHLIHQESATSSEVTLNRLNAADDLEFDEDSEVTTG